MYRERLSCCPECGNTFESPIGSQYARCGHCGGITVDAFAQNGGEPEGTRNAEEVKGPASEPKCPAGSRTCPLCKRKMQLDAYLGVGPKVGRCKGCGMAFADNSQQQELVAFSRTRGDVALLAAVSALWRDDTDRTFDTACRTIAQAAHAPAETIHADRQILRRILALIATLYLGSGAGHFVVGRILRGLLWLALSVALFLLIPLLKLWAVLAFMLLRLTIAIDALVVRPMARMHPWAAVGLALLGSAIVYGVHWSGRALYVEAFKLPTITMFPTLHLGDHIFINKLYRSPERGDVIVFIYPKDLSKNFIKRVVAVGGDRIAFSDDGLISINGRPITRRGLNEACTYESDEEHDVSRPCQLFEEKLGSRTYRVIHDLPSLHVARKVVTVPSGHAFVVGDNRDNSHDSRFFGTIAVEMIKGRADFIWWSRDLGRVGLSVHSP